MSKLKLVNNTISDNLMIFINEKVIYIKKGDFAVVDVFQSELSIKVSLDKKNKVSVKWLNIILTEATNTDARSVIYFDYIFDMKIQNDECELVFSENNYRADESIKLCSVCSVTSREKIYKECYIVSDKGKNPIVKHRLLQLIFLSGLPLIVLGCIYSIFDFQIGVIIAVLILFFIGTIPSIKSIKKFNRIFNNASSLLKSVVEERCDYDKIENIANNIIKDDNTKGSAKLISKILKHFINSI